MTSPGRTVLPRPEPLHFGPAERPLLGWLHPPATDAPARGEAVVVCPPFGYEALCSYRSLRHFASAAARVGFPALRFDYDGTGDSAGSDRDAGRWPAWIASVHHAVERVRASTGVQRVILLGVRLGATIASVAAVELNDVAGLIAIAPVITGKSWLREQRALQIALGLAPAPDGSVLDAESQESVGYLLTAETKAAIQGVNLTSATKRPAPAALVVDRDDRPPSLEWTAHLTAQGATVERVTLPGFVEMMLDPHNAVVPEAMVSAVGQWLEKRPTSPARARDERIPKESVAVVAPGIEEHAVFLDGERRLFGIVTRPANAAPGGRALLIGNSGAIPHAGPGRVYTQWARRWAARGITVLRFDMAGIGESLPWPGAEENVVYTPHHGRDMAAAISHLRTRWGATSVQATGLCSGAYHAIKAATEGLPVDAVVPINPLVYFWKDGMSLDYPSHVVTETAAQYKRSFFQAEKWRKLLTGGVDLRTLANVGLRHLAGKAGGFFRNIARAVGVPLRDDLGLSLRAAARRGITMRFVFSAGDPGQAMLHTEGGWSLGPLLRSGQLRITVIDGPDHTFTPLWSHERLAEALDRELGIP